MKWFIFKTFKNGVQDTSRSGTYHNKKFKETAEAHGLTVEKGEKYGWHKTALSPEALEFVQSLGKQGFTLVRPRPIGLKGSSKGGGSKFPKVCLPLLRGHYPGHQRSSCNLCGL